MNSDQLRQTVAELRALANRIEGKIDTPRFDSGNAPISRKRVGRGVKQPIEAIDLETGEVVQRFASAAETAKEGFTPTSVSMCIRGKLKSHGGYKWQRAA